MHECGGKNCEARVVRERENTCNLTMKRSHGELHVYQASLTIWSYTTRSHFTINVICYRVKILMLYNVQTTNLNFVRKKKRYTAITCGIAYFQIVSDTKYNINALCYIAPLNRRHEGVVINDIV